MQVCEFLLLKFSKKKIACTMCRLDMQNICLKFAPCFFNEVISTVSRICSFKKKMPLRKTALKKLAAVFSLPLFPCCFSLQCCG
jgi:hypothetical protein